MSSNVLETQNSNSLVRSGLYAVIGGVVGGIAFGIIMAIQGMLPMVAALIGASDPFVGFLVHMAISIGIAVPFALIAPRLSGWTQFLIAGAVYGVIWWVLGALILMPTMLGMGEMVLVIGEGQWISLVGHVIYGLLLAGVYRVAASRLS